MERKSLKIKIIRDKIVGGNIVLYKETECSQILRRKDPNNGNNTNIEGYRLAKKAYDDFTETADIMRDAVTDQIRKGRKEKEKYNLNRYFFNNKKISN